MVEGMAKRKEDQILGHRVCFNARDVLPRCWKEEECVRFISWNIIS